MTFSFYPLIVPPDDADAVRALAAEFDRVAEQGLGVYERTRDGLVDRFVEQTLEAGAGASFTTLSFHDTMNTTTRIDGAVDVARKPEDRLPEIVALSNRGDASGDPRGDQPVTMDPARLRALAAAHRSGFGAADDAVRMNQPYLGSQEIIQAGERFRGLAAETAARGVTLDAVQAEFLREFLLGAANTAELRAPGVGWVEPDAAHVDELARACAASWDAYRAR